MSRKEKHLMLQDCLEGSRKLTRLLESQLRLLEMKGVNQIIVKNLNN